ncbi:MAG: hypothetical protein H6704_13510 [Myxococcales bacterium]|nr:hypothetical protein [Myxococcales bacterium]
MTARLHDGGMLAGSFRTAGWDDASLGVWTAPLRWAHLEVSPSAVPVGRGLLTTGQASAEERQPPRQVTPRQARAARVTARLLWEAELPERVFGEVRDILVDSGNPRLTARRLETLFQEYGATLDEVRVIHEIRTHWRPFTGGRRNPSVSWVQGLRFVRAYDGCPDAGELMEALDAVTDAWLEVRGPSKPGGGLRELMWFLEEVLTAGMDEVDPALVLQGRLDHWIVGPHREHRAARFRHSLRQRTAMVVPGTLRPEAY